MPSLALPWRMLVTWLAIYPLVVIAQALVRPVTGGWPPALVTAVVMALVIPVAMLGAVPVLMRLASTVLSSGRGQE